VTLPLSDKELRGNVMFNLIQKFLSKDRSNKSHIRKNFISYFYSLPEHAWILEGNDKTHFDKLFTYLPANLLEAMMTRHPIVFVPSECLKTASFGTVLANTIVVFPEFQNLLKTEKKSAVAYLAHEIAFTLLELEGMKGDSIMAEVEADKFVSDLGLMFELEELLLMLDESVEKRVRLTYLTINHFKDL
jgi:hypothetical protein